jgi:hypothetical protein
VTTSSRSPFLANQQTSVATSALMSINLRLSCNDGGIGAHRAGEMCINWEKFLKSNGNSG